jgi:regulator of sigma E protease
MIVTILIFLLVLSVLVFVHEYGHFFAARRLGVKAEEFGFGFPPRIFGVYKNKKGKWSFVWGKKKVEDSSDTIYSINSIPLGGFVKIKGQDGQEKGEKDSFASKKPWKRAVILSAGVFMNVVLASVLISVGLMMGFPQAVDKENLPKSAVLSDEKVQVSYVAPDSPAKEAGLQISDVIISVDKNEIKTDDDVSIFINQAEGSSVNITVNRFGEPLDLEITPNFNEDLSRFVIGVGVSQTAIVKFPWYTAIWEGIKMTFFLLWAILYAFYEIIKNLIIGMPVDAEVAGPVGIAELTGQMARMGFIYLIQFTALLSLNLAIINLLPIPALDGGRLLFLLFEKIKGRPIKQEVEAVFHNIGFLLLMALIVWVTFKDVLNLFN